VIKMGMGGVGVSTVDIGCIACGLLSRKAAKFAKKYIYQVGPRGSPRAQRKTRKSLHRKDSKGHKERPFHHESTKTRFGLISIVYLRFRGEPVVRLAAWGENRFYCMAPRRGVWASGRQLAGNWGRLKSISENIPNIHRVPRPPTIED
jgi:hypothetical protein